MSARGGTQDRIVRRIATGELYIETRCLPPNLWQARLEAWRADRNLPCPMPHLHFMFETPTIYGCERVPSRLPLFD